MREFSKVSPALWGSPRFNGLASDDAKLLHLFLLTCEHQTSAGVFRLKDAYAMVDLNWTRDRYLVARKQLEEADLVKFDSPSGFILITRWFKHNPPMNASHFKGIMKVILKVDCEALRQEAIEGLQEAQEMLDATKAVRTPKKPENPPGSASSAPVTTISSAMKELIVRKGWDKDTRGAV